MIPSTDAYALAWSGDLLTAEYNSHGPGTFNLNPVGGLSGFWIGETTLASLLNAKASYLDATNIASSVAGGEFYIDIPLSAWRFNGASVKNNSVITNSAHGLPIVKGDNLHAPVATLDPDWQTWAGVVLETRWVNPSLNSGNALIRMRVDTMTTNCVVSGGWNTAIAVPVVAQNTTTYRHTATNAATMGYCSIQLYRSDDVGVPLYLISSRIIPFK
jgi:hypothetical protein